MNVRALTGLNTLVLALAATPGAAQDSPLEEVTVTATRRAENLQEVANSATVFSGPDLRSLGVLEPRDLAEQTPGLLTKFGPNGLATVGFYMRGVGINDFTGTVDPSVGIYVDEVFMPTPDMLNFAVFDIERVEVLRGPQGTLYGRNSTGGAINFILAKPTRELEGFVRAGYGSYESSNLSGAISGPLSETLLGRLSVAGAWAPSDSGYAYNRFTDNHLGKNDSIAVRGQLQWLPTDDFNVRLTYTYGDRDAEVPLLQHVGSRAVGDPSQICAPVLAGRRDESACLDLLGYSDLDSDPYAGDADLDPQLSIRSKDLAATIEWNLGRVTLTAISGYDDFSKRQSQDIDASPAAAANNLTFNDVRNFSQEIRLTSDESFPVQWIVGFNYGKTDVDWFQNIDLTDLAGIPTSNGAEQETEASALFGQITVPFAQKWEAVAGLRYTNEKRDWTGATFIGTFPTLAAAYASGAPILSRLPLPASDPRAGGPLDFDNSRDENDTDFQGVLKYKPSGDAMIYASISQAFRSGGFSSAVIFSQEALEPYDAEDLTAYELGTKLTFPDARLRFNASAFFYDFEGFQATFVRATEASARLQNAGDVETRGLEASLDWYPTDRFSANLGLSLLDSEIVSTSVVLPPLDGGPEQTIEGNEVPNAPKYTLNGRARYDVPMPADLDLGLQLDFSKVASHFLEPNNRKVLEESGYFLLNGRVSLAPRGASWEVSAWVKNVTDEEYMSAAQDLILSLGFAEVVVGLPRTWGVDFEYRF